MTVTSVPTGIYAFTRLFATRSRMKTAIAAVTNRMRGVVSFV